MMSTPALRLLLLTLFALTPSAAAAEDGYELWLRYRPVRVTRPTEHLEGADAYSDDPRVVTAALEFKRAVTAIYGGPVPGRELQRDYVALGTPADLKPLGINVDASGLGPEGYLVRTIDGRGHRIVVAGNSGAGILYGTFALIREIQMGHSLDRLNLRSRPTYPLRMLDHWDNLDRTVERGYAGQSRWNWASLPKIDERYTDYARASASVGINGVVINNVNSDPRILSEEYLRKVVALADLFRPWGIRIYLSARFSAPIDLGGLRTADPLDPAVRDWWRAKADEIYRLIPDFGGFVVKANSEGQPGPQEYHRTHAEGANVIADALRPHGGTVFWRAFVYGSSDADRAKQAYEQFKPLDGKFAGNVILQIKNGPIDFQPREPFHPLFGQMPRTRVALEVQLTREYLGQNTGIAYLGPIWTEVLSADTCSPKCGTPVSSTIAAIAGVANVGTDRNWTGTNFDQANWYAFGRLAWNPHLTANEVATEWTRLTWTRDPRAVRTIVPMMMMSREARVNFMTPLGLAHQMATDHHYGPAPWVCDLQQPSWNPCYYHQADAGGIGYDRTATGSNAIAEYMPEVARRFADPKATPEYLLWFHHVPWDYRLNSGLTLWEGLVARYDEGVADAAELARSWASVRPLIDAERWRAVSDDLAREQLEALWWRDASVAYFQSISKRPIPANSPQPAHPLSHYQVLRPPNLPGQRP